MALTGPPAASVLAIGNCVGDGVDQPPGLMSTVTLVV